MKPPYVAMVLMALTLAGCGEAETGLHRFTLITQGTHTFADGDIVEGDLVVLRGTTQVESGARVVGGIILVSGDLTLNGTVEGNVTMLNGTLRLGEVARVLGNVDVASGAFERNPASTVDGSLTVGEGRVWSGLAAAERSSFGQLAVQALSASALLAALAALVAWSLPRAVGRIGQTAVRQPAVCGALGVLVLVAVPSLLVLMAFTLLLIPIAVLGFFMLGAVALYAWIGLGAAVSGGLSRAFRLDLPAVPRAALGTGSLTLILNLLALIPLVAVVTGVLTLAIGIGAVFLTGFGRRLFVPASEREAAATAAP